MSQLTSLKEISPLARKALLEVQMRGEAAQRAAHSLTEAANNVEGCLEGGHKVHFTSKITRAAAEAAEAITELEMAVKMATLFPEISDLIPAARKGFGALDALLTD